MKPIWLLSAAAFAAAILFVIWPSPASAESLLEQLAPPECKSLKSDLQQTRVLEKVHRRKKEQLQDFIKDLPRIKKMSQQFVDGCEGSSATLCSDLNKSFVKDLNKSVDGQLVKALVDLHKENVALKGSLKQIDDLNGALDQCIAKAEARKKQRAREAKREAARRKASRHRPRHKHHTVIRDAGQPGGGLSAADTAAIIGIIGTGVGIMNATGVLHGGGGGGGRGCHPYRDGRPGMDCSGH